MSRKKCCVAGCDVNSDDPKCRGISYHAFPQDESVRAVWRELVRLEPDRGISRTVTVCSRHFRGADYNQFSSGKFALKARVLPTIFSWGRLTDEEYEKKRTQLVNAKQTTTGAEDAPATVDKSADDQAASMDIVEAKVAETDGATPELQASPSKSKRKRSSIKPAEPETAAVDKPAINVPAGVTLVEIPRDGEWACHWVNDAPIGTPGSLPVGHQDRATVIVEDWRLPAGWVKHMFQRINIPGKWDVVLVGPTGKRFRSKTDLKAYLTKHNFPYNADIFDFSIHRNRAKEINAYVYTKGYTPIMPPTKTPNVRTSAAHNASVSAVSNALNTTVGESTTAPASSYVNIGPLKIEIVDNMYRCPVPTVHACNKLFRKEDHILVHIHYYHKELSKQISEYPKMQNLAGKRTIVRSTIQREIEPSTPTTTRLPPLKKESDALHTRALRQRQTAPNTSVETTPATPATPAVSLKSDTPELLETKEIFSTPAAVASRKSKRQRMPRQDVEQSTPQQLDDKCKRPRLSMPCISQETTPLPIDNEQPEYVEENGERIKLESMRQEEIIHCICAYSSPDGLMIQCELCLCWQHGICNAVFKESDLPEKYVCFHCRTPYHERASMRYKHDQDWLYFGKLPSANYHRKNEAEESKRAEWFKATNTLAGNLDEARGFLTSLKAKVNIVSNASHPKLYLWSQVWDNESDVDNGGEGATKTNGVGPNIPQPEAVIKPEECRHRLMKHIDVQKKHAAQHLDTLEKELETLEQHYGIDENSGVDDKTLKLALCLFSKDLNIAKHLGDVNIIKAQVQRNLEKQLQQQQLTAEETAAATTASVANECNRKPPAQAAESVNAKGAISVQFPAQAVQPAFVIKKEREQDQKEEEVSSAAALVESADWLRVKEEIKEELVAAAEDEDCTAL